MTNITQYKAPALEKGLDILELLADCEDSMTQKEIAIALDRKPSEVFRMIVVLEERGYIQLLSGTERYQLTLKMFRLSNRHSPVKRLNDVAVPLMNVLARKIKQSCQVAVYNSGYVVVVAQVDSSHKYNLSVKPGTRLDLLETASGMVLLAYSSEQQRKSIAAACGVELTDLLNERLDTIVKQGYYKRSSQVLKGVTNIAAPILNYLGEAIASLTVSHIDKGPQAGNLKEVKLHARETAQEISNLLGYDQSL